MLLVRIELESSNVIIKKWIWELSNLIVASKNAITTSNAGNILS